MIASRHFFCIFNVNLAHETQQIPTDLWWSVTFQCAKFEKYDIIDVGLAENVSFLNIFFMFYFVEAEPSETEKSSLKKKSNTFSYNSNNDTFLILAL